MPSRSVECALDRMEGDQRDSIAVLLLRTARAGWRRLSVHTSLGLTCLCAALRTPHFVSHIALSLCSSRTSGVDCTVLVSGRDMVLFQDGPILTMSYIWPAVLGKRHSMIGGSAARASFT